MNLFRATTVPASRRICNGYVMVMYDAATDTYYGWSDHRGLKLPRGVWIKFRGQGRMVEAYNGPAYRNGFHAITGLVQLLALTIQPLVMVLPIFDTRWAEHGAATWCTAKHRKQLPVKEIQVNLRSIRYAGEMVFIDRGPDYCGCVAMEMRIK